MPDSHRSPNSDNEKPKPDRKENEKETEMNEMHLDSPPMPHGAPMDVDSSSFIYVSDENDNDSNFGSEYEMAAEVEENLIQLDEDDDTPNTTGTNVPSAPSAPVNPPTQARGPTGTVSSHPLVPPSSIITTPPTQARSSTGTDISRPLTSYTSYGIATVLPQTKGSAPLSPQLSTATRSIPARSRSFMSPDPTGPPPYSAQSLCVVCNERSAYNDGYRAFPTCGNTCARALEARKKTSSSSRSYSSGGSNSHRSYQTRQTAIKMCEVCHVRPQNQKNGKIFPTCGLTCAAKVQPRGSVEMCEFCRERPKVVLNGHKFPHCGRTCRDKAETADLARANTATCKTCLICWKAEIADQGDFCSDACMEAADKNAPFLLEVPRGHVAFKKISDIYTSGWKNPRTPCPGIKKVYKVVMKPDFPHKYEEYRRKVPSNVLVKRKGNEKQVWLGLRRDCGFGDAGVMEPCSSKQCILCSLVRSSVSKEAAHEGITTTQSLFRAIEMSSQIRRRTNNVVLLADVIFGRKVEITKSEFEFGGEMPPQGYESVHLIQYGTFGLGKVDSEEVRVFNGDAVKPRYLIAHE